MENNFNQKLIYLELAILKSRNSQIHLMLHPAVESCGSLTDAIAA
jgi:hypothetical protein